MPAALFNNAISTSAVRQDKSPEMSQDGRMKEAVMKDMADTDTANRKPQKQSFDYIWRTGVAGGMAGCVVCSPMLGILLHLTLFPGKNSRSPSRSSQDPLPSQQSPICQVCWIMVRCRDSHERYISRRRN